MSLRNNHLDKLISYVEAIMAQQDKDDAVTKRLFNGEVSRRSYAASLRNIQRKQHSLEWAMDTDFFSSMTNIALTDDEYGELRAVIDSHGYDNELLTALKALKENS